MPTLSACKVEVSTDGGTVYSTVDSNSVVTNAMVLVGTNTGDVTLKKASYTYNQAHKLKTTCNNVEGALITVAAKTCSLAAKTPAIS